MLISILAVLASAQAPNAVVPPVVANGGGAPAQSTTTKPKRKKKSCASGDAEVGSHIVMDSCPTDVDEYEALRRAHQAEQAIKFSGAPEGSTGPR